jgi:hypothetical protein
MKVNRFLHRLYSLFDFGGSKDVDPTPGGIPLVFLIVIVPIMLAIILVIAFFFL